MRISGAEQFGIVLNLASELLNWLAVVKFQSSKLIIITMRRYLAGLITITILLLRYIQIPDGINHKFGYIQF